ncbi:hypothetical protein M0802_005821 [Mischocyttarus mexicanus]|nr:hypothetical protein M0802_005821 [Mischocyttarus mexicanus]
MNICTVLLPVENTCCIKEEGRGQFKGTRNRLFCLLAVALTAATPAPSIQQQQQQQQQPVLCKDGKVSQAAVSIVNGIIAIGNSSNSNSNSNSNSIVIVIVIVIVLVVVIIVVVVLSSIHTNSKC